MLFGRIKRGGEEGVCVCVCVCEEEEEEEGGVFTKRFSPPTRRGGKFNIL